MISRHWASFTLLISFPLYVMLWLSGSPIAPQNGIWKNADDIDWQLLLAPTIVLYLITIIAACLIITKALAHRWLIFFIVFIFANAATVVAFQAHLRDRVWFLLYAHGLAQVCHDGTCAYLRNLRQIATLSSCPHLNPQATQYCLAAEVNNGPCTQALLYLPAKEQNNKEQMYADFLNDVRSLALEESSDIRLYSRADRAFLLLGICANQ